MKRMLFFLLIAFTFSLFGITHVKAYRDYTVAVPIFADSFYTSDTVYYYLPIADTLIGTNMYGEIDTSVVISEYPWPSVYDQHSYEVWIGDTATTISSYDRWAMEDWAFCFYITELNVAEDIDSITADVQYQFVNAPAWTVLYGLCTDTDVSANLLTYYPADLYDNWKLYKNARIRLIITSDSVAVSAWLVGRQILIHELVDPGE